MLYFARRWPRMASEQRAHHWERCAIETLDGKTLGIIGLGRVGRAAASMVRSLGVRILGVKGSAAEADPSSFGVDDVCGPRDLRHVLQASDVVVLCLPHTQETVGLIGAEELATMNLGAVLINIARGTIVDEPALVEALRSGHLGGAELDGRREPLHLAVETSLGPRPEVSQTRLAVSVCPPMTRSSY